MILYHGSNIAVTEPQIIVSNRALDFGAGFYTTSSEEQAIRWAKLQALRRLRRRADRVLGGREGGFVGVQFDILFILRLLSWSVGLQRPEAFAQKTAQNSSTSGSMRMTALLA